MKTITKLKALRKKEREQILLDNPGLLARVARKVKRSPQTVSRVYNGKIERSPIVAAELEREIAAIEEASTHA